MIRNWLLVAAAAAVLLVAGGCGDDTDVPAGPSPAEVEDMVEEMVEAAVAAAEQPGLTAADVEEIVETAVAAIEHPELSAADVEEMIDSVIDEAAFTAAQAALTATGVVPPRSSEVEYTRYFVDSAIARYEATGLEATAAYYNSEDSVDGQWYVFILGADDTVLSHYDPSLLGEGVEAVGTDANGHEFWRDMITATEDGKWLAYVWQNPEAGYVSGEFGDAELKNSWVVRYDGLLFGSGWYVDADDFIKAYVNAAVDAFADGGVPGILSYFSSDDIVFSGLASTVDFYDDFFGWDGLAFTAAPDGTILLHTDSALAGKHLSEVFGDAAVTASSEGNWVNAEGVDAATGESVSFSIWAVDYEGTLIAAGWRDDGT